jgi:succinyl-CoA synthetase alpha subunit
VGRSGTYKRNTQAERQADIKGMGLKMGVGVGVDWIGGLSWRSEVK